MVVAVDLFVVVAVVTIEANVVVGAVVGTSTICILSKFICHLFTFGMSFILHELNLCAMGKKSFW